MNNTTVTDINMDVFAGLDFSGVEKAQGTTTIQQPSAAAKTQGVTNFSGLASGAQQKLKAIETEMNNIFVERDSVIRNTLLCLTVGQSMLLLGEPGTGKSALTNELCSRIVGGQYFSWLMNRTSDPAEILGPYSLKEMENDKFIRKTTGMLPEAHIAFLDEIFKSNEPTLNILLPLINEKKIFNGGVATPVPLISLFAASNELPEDESLDALYDRLVIRMYVEYVKDPANKQKMYQGYLANRSGGNSSLKTNITLAEIQALQDASKLVAVPPAVMKNFIKLIGVLSKQGINVSDRRQNECLKILQGSATLEGRNTVVLDDLMSLKYVLWQQKEDVDYIEEQTLKLVNPYGDKVRGFMKNFAEIKANIEKADPSEKVASAIEAKSGLESIINKLSKVIDEASKNGKDISEYMEYRESIISFNQELIQDAMGLSSMFGLGGQTYGTGGSGNGGFF